jgi:hypothetical protein
VTGPVDDEEKARRLFGVLNQKPRPRLTLGEIGERTGMSPAQVRKGWKKLRQTLGEQIAVMEPHREASVYYLSEEFNDGARYMLWQAKHLYTRIASAQLTVRDLHRAGQHMPEAVRPLKQSDRNLGGALANIEQLLGTMGRRAGLTDEELDKMLVAHDA